MSVLRLQIRVVQHTQLLLLQYQEQGVDQFDVFEVVVDDVV
jgi:hypothetical protein